MAPTEPDALGGLALEALPCAMLLVDATLRVVRANAAAREGLGARTGVSLGAALGCVEAAGERCGSGARCAGCMIQRAARKALAGERARARGFLLRAGEGGEPPDLHLLVSAGPLSVASAPHAILLLQDANAILADPEIVHVCGGCGRVEDQEHEWLPLHHYLEDHLGLEASEVLCEECARRSGPAGEP